jgi:hypothetical protein
MMIRQPAVVTDDLLERLAAEVDAKKSQLAVQDPGWSPSRTLPPPGVARWSVYAAEAPTIERLHDSFAIKAFVFDGRRQRHHEIYLGDPRRAAPERLCAYAAGHLPGAIHIPLEELARLSELPPTGRSSPTAAASTASWLTTPSGFWPRTV